MIMNMFLVVTIIVSSLSLVIFQSVRNFRTDSCVEERCKTTPYLFLTSAAMFASDIFVGGNYLLRIATDLPLVIFPLIVVNSLQWKASAASGIIRIFIGIQIISTIYYLLCAFGVMNVIGAEGVRMKSILSGVLIVTLYMSAIWYRIYEIKELMKTGTVWNYVNLTVDCVYMLSLLSAVAVFVSSFREGDGVGKTGLYIVVLILWLEMISLGLRVAFDSVFVIMHKHERVIVESMKISQVEVAPSCSRDDDIYREIYERILLHFEMKKPFLYNSLTINDVVTIVYSNKVYISRAISHYTGRNFRQFVNYYRVMYSMDLFRQRPSMKVAELANLSGFNSVVSYSTAFRLFMNETPSEWCRKEKTKIIKTKK